MSDDPNRQDAEHELDVDLSAFLPEGSRFATDDDELDETAATGPNGEADRGGDADTDVDEAADLDDGWETGAPAPEIPAWARDDLPPAPATDRPGSAPDDAAISHAAPVSTSLTAGDSDAVPGSAPDSVSTPDRAAAQDASPDQIPAPATETDAGPAPVPDAGPVVPTVPEVDTTVLSRIEGELADVDAAIAAIDAGDLARSPLLTELLATDAAPSANAAPANAPAPGSGIPGAGAPGAPGSNAPGSNAPGSNGNPTP